MPENTQQFAQNIAQTLIGDEAAHPAQPLIQMQGIRKSYYIGQPHELEILHGIDLTVYPGEFVAIVGESGSGKSVTALSVLGLLPYPKAKLGKQTSIRFEGRELAGLDDENYRKIRGNRIAYIFQEPMSSLNPLHTIEKQIAESLILHRGFNEKEAEKEVLRLLKLTGIQNAEKRMKS